MQKHHCEEFVSDDGQYRPWTWKFNTFYYLTQPAMWVLCFASLITGQSYRVTRSPAVQPRPEPPVCSA